MTEQSSSDIFAHDPNYGRVSSSSSTTNYEDEQASAVWEQRFSELVHFQLGHGHCRVPTTTAPVDTSSGGGGGGGGALGKWVMHLREKYKRHVQEKKYRGQLTAERIARLENLGFEWSLRPPKVPWEERFRELQAFHTQHGHSRVKRTDSSFGEWVQKQRKLFRAGKLSEERMALLTSIGFEQRLVATNKTWDESFQLLLEFRRKHQHTRVPKPVKGMPPGDDYSLAVWADRQRTYYHTCYMQKKHSPLTKRRVKKLNDVGFVWGTHRVTQQEGWNRRFGELKEYLQQHGDCNVPTVYEQNKALGRWVSEQRANYNKWKKGLKSFLTMERRLALESIGFQWKKSKKKNSVKKSSITHGDAKVTALNDTAVLSVLKDAAGVVDGGDVASAPDGVDKTSTVGQTASI